MIRNRLASFVICASSLMLGVDAYAAETVKAASAPFFLSCNGISGDQKILRIFRVSTAGISVWSPSASKWDQLCEMSSGACAMNEKTIAYAVDYSTMIISRSTGQFESHLKTGSTWIGACSSVDDPSQSKAPSTN